MKLPEYFTVKQFCSAARISRRTWDYWQTKGFTPETTLDKPGGQLLIPRHEWLAWFNGLERDRRRLGKPYLNHPVSPRREWLSYDDESPSRVAFGAVAVRLPSREEDAAALKGAGLAERQAEQIAAIIRFSVENPGMGTPEERAEAIAAVLRGELEGRAAA